MPKREDERWINIQGHPPVCNCAKCVERRIARLNKVSWAWWLLPIFLTWIGGLIAWGCTRKRIGKKARTYIWVGIATFVLGRIIALAWLGIGG